MVDGATPPQDRAGGSALETVWRERERLSSAANGLKRDLDGWRTAAFALAIVGAVLETAAAQLPDPYGRASSWVGAVALGLVPFIYANRLDQKRVSAWVKARAASEALKSQLYLYRTGSEPYHQSDRDKVLRENGQRLLEQVDELAVHLAAVHSPEAPAPGGLSLDEYIDERVNGQIEFYRRNAQKLARRVGVFRRAEFLAALVATVLGVIAAFADAEGVGIWVAVLTTVGATVAAHVTAARFEPQIIQYNAAARRLGFLRDELPSASGEYEAVPAATRSSFVRESEGIILMENQAWAAEMLREPKRDRPEDA